MRAPRAQKSARSEGSQGVETMDLEIAEWLVTDGERVVGPVSLALITKAVESGKLSLDAMARQRDSREWTRLGDIPAVRDSQKLQAAEGERSSLTPEDRAFIESERAGIEGASTLREAALYLLVAVVSHLDCEGGLVHIADASGDFTTACAHGPRADELLGRKVSRRDPAVLPFFVYQQPDARGQFMTGLRLTALGVRDHESLALPLRIGTQLIGVIELSPPRDRAFGPADIDFVRRLAQGLAKHG